MLEWPFNFASLTLAGWVYRSDLEEDDDTRPLPKSAYNIPAAGWPRLGTSASPSDSCQKAPSRELSIGCK